MRLEPVTRAQLARSAAGEVDHRIGGHVDVEALPAQVHLGNAEVDGVLDVVLVGLGVEVHFPFGEERVVLELQVVATGFGAALVAIVAARDGEVVVFVPAAHGDLVHAEIGGDATEQARTAQRVFRRAQRHVHPAGRGDIRRAPGALAIVAMVVGLELERERPTERRSHADCAERVTAQTGRIVVGIIGAGDRRRIGGAGGRVERGGVERGERVATVGADFGDLHGQRILVGAEVVPVEAQPLDHVEAEVLVVLLGAVRMAEEAVEIDIAHRHDRLGVDGPLALLAIPLPLVGGAIDERTHDARGIGLADRGTHEAAIAVVRTRGRTDIERLVGAAEHHGRVHRGELERAAEVVGRLRVDRTRTLADGGATDVFGDDRTADVQAVVVAIGHVAQRNAVEREAELVLVEAADGDARRPFVVAEGVGGLEVDAGQLFDRLQRAGTRGENGDVGVRDFLDLAGLASAEDDDFRRCGSIGRGRCLILCKCGRAGENRRSGEQVGYVTH